jgi:restriction system protein
MDNVYTSLMSPWLEPADDLRENSRVDYISPLLPEVSEAKSSIVLAHQNMMNELGKQLLSYVYAQSHLFFEALIIDVMLAMGYGGRRRDFAKRLGKSGDGGIDGVIAMDELGLDVIYLQAKRLKPNSVVPISAVRDFIGSLESKHSNKGIFVTTAQFSSATKTIVEGISKKVVLIDGRKLTELMVRHNIGARPTETLQFKKIDLNYFKDFSPRTKSRA